MHFIAFLILDKLVYCTVNIYLCRNMEKSYKEVIGAAEDGIIIQGVFDCARVLEM